MTGREGPAAPAPPARAVRLTLAAALAAALLFPAGALPAAAQVPTLDRVDSLITAGAYDDARTTLDRWWSARETFDVPGSDRARALMLRAQLRTEPAEAEQDYLAIVLGYPTADQAPEALLRLGQVLLGTGQAARAASYLQRLVADYPGRPQRTPGLLWLARALSAARQPAAACRAARDGLLDARDHPDLAAMLRLEEAAVCAIPTGQERPEPAQPQPTPRPQTPPRQQPETRPTQTAPVPGVGSYAVQSGAFRFREGADALAARLRDAGHDARLVRVPANDLLRVRVGRFATAEEAARLVQRLRATGFDAVVVSDADRERSP